MNRRAHAEQGKVVEVVRWHNRSGRRVITSFRIHGLVFKQLVQLSFCFSFSDNFVGLSCSKRICSIHYLFRCPVVQLTFCSILFCSNDKNSFIQLFLVCRKAYASSVEWFQVKLPSYSSKFKLVSNKFDYGVFPNSCSEILALDNDQGIMRMHLLKPGRGQETDVARMEKESAAA